MEPNTSSPKNTRLLLSVGALAVVAVAAALWWWQDAAPKAGTSYENFIGNNSAFAQAEELRVAGNRSEAAALYQKALEGFTDIEDEGGIKLRLAFVDPGTYAHKISLLKEVAADVRYSRITRAYAVFNMADLFYSTSDPEITKAIFSDEKYAKYKKSNDLTSYRRLAEYAASLYPIAFAELRIAQWHASHIERLLKQQTPDKAEIERSTAIIHERMEKADRDIARIAQQHDNYFVDIPRIFLLRAQIISKQERVGNTSFGTTEDAFMRALDAYVQYGKPGSDGYARFYYSSALQKKYGKERQKEIQTLLAPLYTGTVYENTPVMTYFKNERANLLGSKSLIIQVAGLDPDFKSMLRSLGWTEEDFVRRSTSS